MMTRYFKTKLVLRRMPDGSVHVEPAWLPNAPCRIHVSADLTECVIETRADVRPPPHVVEIDEREARRFVEERVRRPLRDQERERRRRGR